MRIIAGEWRSRPLPRPGKDVRPTPDRAREALFSILYSRGLIFEKTRALDLYCGCGSLGLELLSRGGTYVGFVDQSRKNIAAIEQFLEKTGARDRGTGYVAILPEQLSSLTAATQGVPVDLIFADAPFSKPLHPAVLLRDPVMQHLLAEQGTVVWEQESTQPEYEEISGWSVSDCRKYGRIRLWFFQRST